MRGKATSLKLSKRLMELGTKQESTWYWIGWYGYSTETTKMTFSVKTNSEIEQIERDFHVEKICSAPTVAELGEMLPDDIIYYKATEWFCEEHITENCSVQHADTEADARAKMLIWFIENKRTKAEEL